MKYWGILAGKLVLCAALLYAIWVGMHAVYTPPAYLKEIRASPFMHDLAWTTALFFYNLLCQGLIFLILLDQRYRCRKCGRRLRMPVRTGRYAQVLLFGAPKTEYICTYGHGTLRVPEVHLSGKEPSSWEPNDADIWKELYDLDRRAKS